MKNFVLFVLAIVVAAVSALFFAQNDTLVEIKYFGGSFEWPLHWVLVSMLFIGVLLGFFSILTNLLTTKVRLANTKRKLAKKDKELSQLQSSSLVSIDKK